MGGGGEEEEGNAVKVMEGVASIALLPGGSISGHFIQLPNSICYGLHGFVSMDVSRSVRPSDRFLECERECSRGEDYRLIKLTVTDYNSRKERVVVVECRGHDAAKICTTDHAHG
ncbi:hypothetical protein OROMI_030019 [Orobanche minor]